MPTDEPARHPTLIELAASEIDEVARQLVQSGRARLREDDLEAVLDTSDDDIDLVFRCRENDIGFITVSRYRDGFRIVGDPYLHGHRGFGNEIDVGIEVKPSFRRRGYANLLIQIATRIAQLTHAQDPLPEGFRIYATGVRYPEQKRRLGFTVRGNRRVGYTAEFRDPEHIPMRQKTALERAVEKLEGAVRGLSFP